ncbi:MAG: acyl-CoA thioesterase [Clostridia bacterium]|nr:acyl-CoA thioesterase [Clostridia bacterium]
MHDYIRKVNYYETDKMGITHHSNYIRWMEEARTDFLERNGCGYQKFEADGIVSPVISVECRYKHSTTFDDRVKICIEVEKYTGVSLTFRYIMTNADTGVVVATGKSSHCFVDQSGAPIIVKKRYPELDATFKSLVPQKATSV